MNAFRAETKCLQVIYELMSWRTDDMRHMKTWLQFKKKLSLGKHHKSNSCRNDPLVNASGWKFGEKYDLHSLNAYPQRCFLTTKRVTLLWRNWQKPPYPSDPDGHPRSRTIDITYPWYHAPRRMLCHSAGFLPRMHHLHRSSQKH